MKSISDLIISLGTMPFEIWLFLVVSSIVQIRMHLSDIMFGSFCKIYEIRQKKGERRKKRAASLAAHYHDLHRRLCHQRIANGV